MIQSRSTFKFDPDSIEKMGRKFSKRMAEYDVMVEQRVKRATNMVWQIAHQKRPMITKVQMRAQGRTRRVSDPTAIAGVPVRTGKLQESIKQKVMRGGFMTFFGEVYTRGVPYAAYMEYGPYKRPFMRPAVNLTKEAIKRMFRLDVRVKV